MSFTDLMVWQLPLSGHHSDQTCGVSFCFTANIVFGITLKSDVHHALDSLLHRRGKEPAGCMWSDVWCLVCNTGKSQLLSSTHLSSSINFSFSGEIPEHQGAHTNSMNVDRPVVFPLNLQRALDQNLCSCTPTHSCIQPYCYSPLSKWILMMIIEESRITLLHLDVVSMKITYSIYI